MYRILFLFELCINEINVCRSFMMVISLFLLLYLEGNIGKLLFCIFDKKKLKDS